MRKWGQKREISPTMPQSEENQRQHSDATRARANTHTRTRTRTRTRTHAHKERPNAWTCVGVCKTAVERAIHTNHVHESDNVVCVVWRIPKGNFIQDAAQGPQICSVIIWLLLDELWCLPSKKRTCEHVCERVCVCAILTSLPCLSPVSPLSLPCLSPVSMCLSLCASLKSLCHTHTHARAHKHTM